MAERRQADATMSFDSTEVRQIIGARVDGAA